MPVTLRECLADYLAAVGDTLSTTRTATLRYTFRRWESLEGTHDPAAVTPAELNRVRGRGLESGLRPASIETMIADVRTVLRHAGIVVGKGRRLKLPAPLALQPSLDEIGKLYAACAKARWPIVPARYGWRQPRKNGESMNYFLTRTLPQSKQTQRAIFWRGLVTLSLFTGFRLADLLKLRWGEHVLPDRISLTANKTGKVHQIPITPTVARHLDELRSLGSDRMFGIKDCSRNRNKLREELKRLCEIAGIGPVTPKMFRAAAVTTWTITGPGCGEIVHGCGCPTVLRHYRNDFQVLAASADKFPWPVEMLTKSERTQKSRSLAALRIAASRLTPDKIAELTRIAGAIR